MRILILSQWFDPEPTLKGHAFAKALREEGHDVAVLTGFPNYPGGVIYPGFRQRLFQREEIDGVTVVRVPLFPSHDASGIRRAIGYASFGLSAALIGVVLTRRPDVIYAYHPPLTTGLAGVALSITRGVPLIYDIQDLWPDTLAATGMVRSRRVLDAVGNLCRLVYRKATRVVVLSSGFKQALIDRGVPAHKIHVIPNWADEGRLRVVADPELSSLLSAGDHFNVVFAGTMGRAQGLDTVLDAAALLRDGASSVRFLLVGGGVEAARLSAAAERRGLDNVRFLPPMPMDKVGGVLALAHALLVHLRDDPLFAITIPSKTQAYLAAGKPVVMAVRGDAAELITASGGGIVCEPDNPVALADAVSKLALLPPRELEDMGKRGAEFYKLELSLQKGAARFATVFQEACGGEE